ncbi:TolC family protein, partial [bacterium]|nr:TolC family protein [bacterium]
MKLKLISLTLFSCVIMPTTCVLAQADSSFLAVQSVQNIRKLSLREIFSLADKNNKDLKVLSSQIESTNEDISSVKQMLLPDISATASVSYLGNGRIWDRDFTNPLTAEIPHFGNNFSLQVNQIIFAGGSIMSAVRQAELGKQISMTMQQQIKSGIHFLLAGYYLDI